MGIDFLELSMQLEKKHDFYIKDSAMKAMPEMMEDRPRRWWGGGLDVRLGPFYELLCQHAVKGCVGCQGSPKRTRWWKFQWRNDQERIGGTCPTCGGALERGELAWEEFRDVLAGILRKKPELIHRESWLFRDLGFS